MGIGGASYIPVAVNFRYNIAKSQLFILFYCDIVVFIGDFYSNCAYNYIFFVTLHDSFWKRLQKERFIVCLEHTSEVLPIKKYRDIKSKLMKKILLSAAFVAAFSVVSAQSISYLPFTENALMTGIGLAVPHIARMVLRSDNYRVLLPSTMAVGAVVALLCNYFCTSPWGGIVIPVNVVTPLVGATQNLIYVAATNSNTPAAK